MVERRARREDSTRLSSRQAYLSPTGEDPAAPVGKPSSVPPAVVNAYTERFRTVVSFSELGLRGLI